ncbi:MAG: ABC transporter ATP-binding protein, partial [Clostridia bacterium]|nr:ABC transporter ATP-binding protein [Clostridia bacterium]
KGKTTILIAHRISTVEGMDKIIFLDDGRVSAVGTHRELLMTCPDYRTMVELQQVQGAMKESGSPETARANSIREEVEGHA